MRMRKYIINLFAAAALLVGCGESLEDTYSDYAGDGKIRYVAKCTEVHATPGWERLLLEWINIQLKYLTIKPPFNIIR